MARGGVGNPELITNINNIIEGKELVIPTIEKQISYFKEFKNLLVEEKGEKIATSILKGIAPKFFLMFKEETKELRKQFVYANSIDEFDRIIDEFFKKINF